MPLGQDVDEALAVEREGHGLANLGSIEWRRGAVDDQVGALVRRFQIADRIRCFLLYLPHQRRRYPERKRHVELAGIEGEYRRRAISNYRPFDAVEIRTSGFPVLFVPDELDRLIRLIGNKFEWSGADRVSPHAVGRYVTRIDRRITGGKQGKNGRLRSLQVERKAIALGADRVEVVVPGLARVGAQLVWCLAQA